MKTEALDVFLEEVEQNVCNFVYEGLRFGLLFAFGLCGVFWLRLCASLYGQVRLVLEVRFSALN